VRRFDYHAIVVGSGFGGSVVAHRLATHRERPWDVCLLERGKSHPPGKFPRTPYEAKRGFWDPDQQLHGLFDVWSFSGLAAVVASGVGGGSLIYANVLERPPDGWLSYTDPEYATRRKWPLKAGDRPSTSPLWRGCCGHSRTPTWGRSTTRPRRTPSARQRARPA
jgi:cholesterol oxidase